jgi:hypothetical protein
MVFLCVVLIFWATIGGVAFAVFTVEGSPDNLNNKQLIFVSIACGPIGWICGGLIYGLRYFADAE